MLVCSFSDITERRRAETALKESEDGYRHAEEAANLGHWAWDMKEHRLTYASYGLAKQKCMTPEEFMASESSMEETLKDLHPEDRERYADTILAADEHGVGFEIEYRVIYKGGDLRHFYETGFVSRYEDGVAVEMRGISQDITELKRAEDALREADARLRTALDAMTDSIYIMDKDLNFVLVNDRYHEFFDLSKKVLRVGSPVEKAIRELALRGDYGDGDVDEIVTERMKGISNDQVNQVEMPVKNGKRIINVRKAPVDGGGAVIVGTDVTERRQMVTALRESEEALRKSEAHLQMQVLELRDREERLEAQGADMVAYAEDLSEVRDELERLNGQKDKFFSIIAHDLKGPFNALLGYSSLLSSGAATFDQEKVVEYSGAVHQSAERVFKLLENLLEWARLQMEQLEFEPGPVDLKEIMDTNLALFAPTAREKAIRLIVKRKQAISVFADAHMVDTIIRNLVNNAIKFTPEKGSVTVNARQNGKWAHIEVSDTGVGMSADKMTRLFDLGEQTSSMGTGGEAGTGLGLQLCKELVEKQGGQIDVNSIKGKGSVFHFTLPIHQK